MAEVRFENVYKYYKPETIPAVNDFNLEIEDGEFVVLVGPSGCGKTTTLRMLSGLESVSKGDIYIGDRYINYISPKNRDIAMVFQNYALYPNLTVYENMALGLKLRKEAKYLIDMRVKKAARILEIAHLFDRKPEQLSGGQKQRVALGRAIVREPAVFLMDEPLSNLDAMLRTQTRAELIRLHQELRTTTLYVTHDQTEAMTMGSRIVIMNNGIIQQAAPPREVYNQPANRFVAGFIGSPAMNFINGTIVSEEDKLYFDNHWMRISIPEKFYPSLNSVSQIRNITLGIRPEHVICDPELLENYEDRMKMTLDIIEQMGSDTYLYLVRQNERIISRLNESFVSFSPNETVEFTFNMEKAHFFDAESGISLLNYKNGLL